MFSKDICIKLLQFLWNGRQDINAIFHQHTKAIIIDVPKSSMPQETRRQCTFIMMRKVCIILCMSICLFQLQQSSILHSCHNNHVVGNLPYLNFATKDMNRFSLRSNVYKRQQVPSQFRKTEHIMQKKIWESRQFHLDGANS